jgi:hypothetical protein
MFLTNIAGEISKKSYYELFNFNKDWYFS